MNVQIIRFDEYSNKSFMNIQEIEFMKSPPQYGSRSMLIIVTSVHEDFTVKELKKFQYRLTVIIRIER